MRRALATAATTALALAVTVLAPLPAQAATAPVVTAVGSVAGDPGLVTVTASSDTAITSITVVVNGPYGGPTVAATLTSFTRTSGTSTDGTWQSTVRLSLSTYAPYTLHATVVDADGDSSADTTAELAYQLQPRVGEHSISSTDLDRLHPQLTATGRIDKLDPATGLVSPYAGYTVQLSLPGGGVLGPTGSDGRYSLSVTPWRPTDGQTLQYSVSGWMLSIDTGTVTTHLTPTRVVIDPAPARLAYGKGLTVSGTVEMNDGGSWVPVAGVPVTLMIGGTQLDGTTPGADGRFTFAQTAYRSGTYSVVLDTYQHQWYADATGEHPLTVVNPTAISWFSPSINEFSELTVHGAVVNTGDFTSVPTGGRLYVQRSTDGRTWASLGWIPLNSVGAFDLDAYLPQPSGWFRLYGVPTGDFAPSYSKAYKLSRTNTRIAKASLPSKARKGATVTLKGAVQKQVGSAWKPIAKARVYVFFRADGSTKFRQVTSVVAGKDGRFAAAVRPKKKGSWVAVWFTTSSRYLNAYGPLKHLTVR